MVFPMKTRSLTRKLLAVALLCGAVPAVLGLGYNIYSGWRFLARRSMTEMETRVRDQKNLVVQQVEKFRQILLTTSHNPAFTRYFAARDPAERETWRREAERAIGFLTATFKGMIDESCFIHGTGAEVARVTFGEPAPPEDLSPDESGSVFFRPTMDAAAGQVVMAGPYVSPDSNRPVLAFATPIVDEAGRKLAILHMEVPLSYFRQLLADNLGEKGAEGGGSESGFYFLADGQGRVLVRTDSEVPTTGRYDALSAVLGIERLTEDVTATGRRAGRDWLLHADLMPELGIFIGFAHPDERMAALLAQSLAPVGAAVTALALVLALAAWLSRRVTRPIARLTEAARALESGDVETARSLADVTSRDEVEILAHAFLALTERFETLVAHLRDATAVLSETQGRLSEAMEKNRQAIATAHAGVRTLATSADAQMEVLSETARQMRQVEDSILQVAQGTERQVVAAEEASNAINTMTATASALAAAVARVRESARSSRDKAEAGITSVQNVLDHVSVISETVQHAFSEAVELATESEKIVALTATIDNVARHTNLLALNAAIEAARAGHLGQGFAVVAEEVRRLADQVRQAAEQISSVTQEMKRRVTDTCEAMQASVSTVSTAVEDASRAGEHLNSILGSTQEAEGAVASIAEEIQHLSGLADQASAAFQDVAGIAAQNASAAQEMAAISQEVVKLVQEVVNLSRESSGSALGVLSEQEAVTAGVAEVQDQGRAMAEAASRLESLLFTYGQIRL